MPKVKITVTNVTTLGFKPEKGYRAEQIVKWMRENKLSMEGNSLVKDPEPPSEGGTVVATITSAVTGGGKRTVELV